MRLYTRWLNLSQNRLLDVTNLRLFFSVRAERAMRMCPRSGQIFLPIIHCLSFYYIYYIPYIVRWTFQ